MERREYTVGDCVCSEDKVKLLEASLSVFIWTIVSVYWVIFSGYLKHRGCTQQYYILVLIALLMGKDEVWISLTPFEVAQISVLE